MVPPETVLVDICVVSFFLNRVSFLLFYDFFAPHWKVRPGFIDTDLKIIPSAVTIEIKTKKDPDSTSGNRQSGPVRQRYRYRDKKGRKQKRQGGNA